MVAKYVILFLAAGALVVAIALLASRGHSVPAGLLVLVPVLSLVSYAFVGASEGEAVLKPLVLHTFLGVPPLLVFLAGLYLFLKRFPVVPSLALSFLLWLVSAAAVLAVVKVLAR